MTEDLTDDWGFFIRSARAFERFRSPYQAVEVHDTRPFGKLFRLDGHFMTSEKDEFFYHENLVHLAAVTHPAPERALIIGGGDGGSAEELLKHPSIKSVTCARSTSRSSTSRASTCSGAPRRARRPALTLRDRRRFRLRSRGDRAFDLIVLDLTDPGGPSTPLYTSEFYRACAPGSSPAAR